MKKSKNKNQISETDLLTYGKYLLVGTFLQHSNRIQLRYKMTTFTWFIATFIGVGYSLSDMEINLPFHPLLISAVLCLAKKKLICNWDHLVLGHHCSGEKYRFCSSPRFKLRGKKLLVAKDLSKHCPYALFAGLCFYEIRILYGMRSNLMFNHAFTLLPPTCF